MAYRRNPAPMSKPTINDVARIAGVSKKTVSRVINRSPLLSTATRERVEAVIAETSFVPNPQARALALRRNFLVALVHDEGAAAIVPEVSAALGDALRGSEYALVLNAVRGDAADDLRMLLEAHRPAAVVLLAGLAQDARLVDLCEDFGAECLLLDTRIERTGMTRLVAWLMGKGHRRIGFVTGSARTASQRAREEGYRQALVAQGVDVLAAWIATADGSFREGIEAGRALLRVRPRLTAIAAFNDETAVGVIHAATQAGVTVPQMLSVTGFEDTPLAERLWPPLTSMRLPWAAAARAAILPLLGNDEAVEPEPPELIVRESVASPKGSGTS